MLEEIYKRAGEYKDKYRSDPDILCADQETLEKIIKEIPRLKNSIDLTEVYPDIFNMKIIVTIDDGYGYQLFDKSDLDNAIRKYDSLLYPEKLVRIRKFIFTANQKVNTNPSAKCLGETKSEWLDIPQGVIGAYKRFLKS